LRWAVVVFGSILVLAAGCGSSGKQPSKAAAQPSASASAPAPSATASTPPPFDRASLSEQLKGVLIAQNGLVKLGGPSKTTDDFDGQYPSSDFCGQSARNEGRSGHVAHMRLWKGNGFDAVHVAHGFNGRTGAEAVAEARANAAQCKTYQQKYSDGISVKYDLLDVVDLGTVTGLDASFAICDKRAHSNGYSNVACTAYLGRKQFVSVVSLQLTSSVSAAKAKLLQVVPIAAAALTTAAP
jgi:hypothetical protein